MHTTQAIYTEKNNCQDCYKCIRWCPVKSIKVEEDSASIVSDDCILCGRCTLICPANAKKVRNDVPKVKELLKTNSKVIASVAPSYAAEFPEFTEQQFIGALKQLGFSEVSETAIGATYVSKKCNEMLNSPSLNYYLSSACPSVVKLIQSYYPHLTKYITPIMSPLMAHASVLRQMHNNNVKVVFIGPCIAKKNESDEHPNLIDAVLTFDNLKEWLKDENINYEDAKPEESVEFYPYKASSTNKYPIEGGMIHTLKQDASLVDVAFMSFSGIGSIKKVLSDLENWEPKQTVFLELLSCEQGCINGPSTSSNKSLAEKRYAVAQQTEPTENNTPIYNLDRFSMEIKAHGIQKRNYADIDIAETLELIGKTKPSDELNCGGCGYDTCRDFAAALIDNKAEQNMCVSYMRKMAQDKASALLQKMPAGVIMVDDNMKIIEGNRKFAELMGNEISELYEINPGLVGASLEKILPCYKLFATALQNGEAYLEKDVRENGKLFHLTIFTIQKHRIVCGLFRNLFAPEIRNEEVILRTKMVIKENLTTVQKIAMLLGENASKTEAMLNSIVESHHTDELLDEY